MPETPNAFRSVLDQIAAHFEPLKKAAKTREEWIRLDDEQRQLENQTLMLGLNAVLWGDE